MLLVRGQFKRKGRKVDAKFRKGEIPLVVQNNF